MNITNRSLCEKANQITLTIFTYGHAKISPAWRGESFNRPFSYLYYVYKGKGVIQIGNKTVELLAGNWYLIPSGCNFKYACPDFMEHIYFHISFSRADKLDMFRNLKEPLRLPEKNVPEALFEHVKDSKDLLSILTIKSQIYETVLRILSGNNISVEEPMLSECVLTAIKYITANLSAKLTSVEIAANAFVSKSKLTKQFRKELSMSVQDYLYNILMSEASNLIMNTSLSFSEISERLGFSDQFYFSRKFRQKYGLSPRAYRSQMRNILQIS